MAENSVNIDPRLLTLAAEIAEATDREVPTLLLEVRGKCRWCNLYKWYQSSLSWQVTQQSLSNQASIKSNNP